MASLDTIGSNNEARRIAQSLGYGSAEELKGEYVPPSEISRVDMKYDKSTREIVLVIRSTGEEIHTGLYFNR